ncbi:hypothetical protein ES708_01540 [subsurface metagenome]
MDILIGIGAIILLVVLFDVLEWAVSKVWHRGGR